MTALAFVVICTVALFSTRGFAWGAQGDVLGVRFGADGDRTRVVIDLDKSTQGRVIDTGAAGRVTLALNGVAPGRGLNGGGSGLVRSYQVSASGGASRIELELARGSEIERRFLLPPGDGVAHYRYVVDLKAVGGAIAASRPAPRTTPAPRRAERPLIVIDAGHGGKDPGASGALTREKQVTLAAALVLKTELERTGRYRVRLTRADDTYVDLYRRVSIARQSDADLFISLHADAGSDPALRGASVYTLSEQGAGRAVREFTRTDNWHRELHLPGRDPSVDRILLDMTQRATQNRSAQFARVLLTHLEGSDHPLLRRSHRDAGLAVLLAPDVPAVLLEMGFITNPEDERLLTDERARRRLMKSVADGIDRYFREPTAPLMTASTDGAGQP
ncbi:MAG: N-acetylmuramoyl-L-alanine amidase [Brevundimonas sp.]|jgi:N-acetylmuramoyl-L-alanine amidase|nr:MULTISPECIES: N-acetylmuramoyl-L-alanine amidase [Brevundimonas]EDX78980.1 N-acetylmuramoyl-L-alanine amidase domain protein [Brevundimonas sp. BAL3]VDC50573.1 N-acetylmuramoyl-L-alanine amidase AmiC [Brevundimonas mediterranea]